MRFLNSNFYKWFNQIYAMKRIALFAFFFSLVPFVAAQHEICSYVVDERNVTAGMVIPSFLPYPNDRFMLYTQDEELIGHVIIRNREIVSIDCTEIDTPTFVVSIKDLSTVQHLFTSQTPVSTLDSYIAQQHIRFEGQSFGKKTKQFFTRVGIKIASWFE